MKALVITIVVAGMIVVGATHKVEPKPEAIAPASICGKVNRLAVKAFDLNQARVSRFEADTKLTQYVSQKLNVEGDVKMAMLDLIPDIIGTAWDYPYVEYRNLAADAAVEFGGMWEAKCLREVNNALTK